MNAPAAPIDSQGESPVRKVIDRIYSLLGEETQVTLALIAFTLAVQDLVFGVPAVWKPILDRGQLIVILLFGLEFLCAWYLAPNRLKFILRPLRILDLVILTLSLLSFHPQLANSLVHGIALKLVRFTPVLFFGYRSTRDLVVMPKQEEPKDTCDHGDFFQIHINDGVTPEFEPKTREDLATWIADPQRKGCYGCSSDFSPDLAKRLNMGALPPSFLHTALTATSFPRVVRVGEVVIFSGSVPRATGFEFNLNIESTPFLALCTTDSILVMTPGESTLIHTLVKLVTDDNVLLEKPNAYRLCAGLFVLVMNRYEEISGSLEVALRGWEQLPLSDFRKDSRFTAAFMMSRSIAGLKADIWRLGHFFDRMNKGKLQLSYSGPDLDDMIGLLSDRCDFLKETFTEYSDRASAFLDLRLNLLSFQMNRFMGLLAVVTGVGIIPATIGGFLGMNIDGTNFPFSLGNVSYLAAMMVVLVLYMMKRMGWLRF